MNVDAAKPWYHGSPLVLDTIREGSTITQRRDLACIFSHKPTLVSQEDDGSIRHNGARRGYLYRIAEDVAPEDVTPHPRTTMSPGDEWLTRRELRLELLEVVEVAEGELLSEEDVRELLERLAGRG